MLDLIAHRVPDGWGEHVEERVSFGMRRLAIIDPDDGHQPVWSDDGQVGLIFNGEIYNHPGLRKELERRGHRFRTDHSDTETILRGYEEWSTDVVRHLVGMFAFAIWDRRRGELFLARDRLGIKPLYYVAAPGRFAFASEMKALFVDPAVERRADLDRVHQFVLYRVHDNDQGTFFDGVDRLLPGHWMTVGAEGIRRIERYWHPHVNPEFASDRPDESDA